jgi:GH15 family glucan-1,4-alpha-glucosidase
LGGKPKTHLPGGAAPACRNLGRRDRGEIPVGRGAGRRSERAPLAGAERRAAGTGASQRNLVRLEDLALVGDLQTAALVDKDGSVVWLCVPRFDSDACFAALLGGPEHGRWRIAPAAPIRAVRRRYRTGTLVLETEMDAADGTIRIVDCMPQRGRAPELIRIVEGVRGRTRVRMELAPRFGYGSARPWRRALGPHTVELGAGPDALLVDADVALSPGEPTAADLALSAGERAGFSLAWHAAHAPPPPVPDRRRAVEETEATWRAWSDRCTHRGPWREQVIRSLVTLKALTYAPTGGIVAAPTTSLPERLGGIRNWDYRFCWLRDATFSLLALMDAGYFDEARAWRDWLLRAVAGDPAQVRILYGIAGERRTPETELPWLPGYEGARPVRIGNLAADQLQLDVYGEVTDCLHHGRQRLGSVEAVWGMERALVEHLETVWREPDAGIWEMRGPPRAYTHSKVMAWVAFDRAVRAVEGSGLPGPADRWRRTRDAIHAEVCARGYDSGRNTFTIAYGEPALDAALLLIPEVGFLPPTDRRVRGTIEAVQRELVSDGLVHRYLPDAALDGLPSGEGVFLACSLWLADALALVGRPADARRLLERVGGLANDVGLLSEEYDVGARRLVGNFPQAFSHVALVNTARNLTAAGGPSERRPG